MYQELKQLLENICNGYNSELNEISTSSSGSCYLTGHCLSIGLEKLGYKTKETTGVLFLKDKVDKYHIYGQDKYQRNGNLVGNYHTWCVLEFDGEEIIIDPSLGSLKSYLKSNLKVKIHDKIPNCLISNQNDTYYYRYIKDDKLIPQSKSFLNKIDPELINHLVNKIVELSQ